MMKRTMLAMMAVCLVATGAFAAKKDKAPKSDISVVRDEPLGKTFYMPARRLQVKDEHTRWQIYPYVAQNADGSVYLCLNLDVEDDSPSDVKTFRAYFEQMKFIADGKDELPLDLLRSSADNIYRDYRSYGFTYPEIEKTIRRLADAREAWLVAYALGDHARNNVKLTPENLEPFRLIVAEYERLQELSLPAAGNSNEDQGKQGVLFCSFAADTKIIPVSPSLYVLHQIKHSEVDLKDRQAAMDIYQRGKVLSEEPGTKILVLDGLDNAESSAFTSEKVQILSGIDTGQTGWVLKNCVKLTPSETSRAAK